MSYTDEIFKLSAPYNNHYQGNDFKALFVCSAGLLRSATAANLLAKKGWNTRSCGSSEYALIPISANLIYWADKIYFMNSDNYFITMRTFDNFPEILAEIRVKGVIFDIEDKYEYNNEELVRLLKDLVKEGYDENEEVLSV